MAKTVNFDFEFGVTYPTDPQDLEVKRMELQDIMEAAATDLDTKVRKILNVPKSVVSSRQVNRTQKGV